MTTPPDAPDALAHLAALAEAVAGGCPDPLVRAAETADRTIGHALFTVMRFDAPAMAVERLHSSQPEAYPPGGRKPKRDTAWGRQVLLEGRPFLGTGEAAIRWAFADADTILGLGLQTVLNMPVRAGGRTLGTVNLLRAAPGYAEADLGPARLLAAILVPVLQRAS